MQPNKLDGLFIASGLGLFVKLSEANHQCGSSRPISPSLLCLLYRRRCSIPQCCTYTISAWILWADHSCRLDRHTTTGLPITVVRREGTREVVWRIATPSDSVGVSTLV